MPHLYLLTFILRNLALVATVTSDLERESRGRYKNNTSTAVHGTSMSASVVFKRSLSAKPSQVGPQPATVRSNANSYLLILSYEVILVHGGRPTVLKVPPVLRLLAPGCKNGVPAATPYLSENSIIIDACFL